MPSLEPCGVGRCLRAERLRRQHESNGGNNREFFNQHLFLLVVVRLSIAFSKNAMKARKRLLRIDVDERQRGRDGKTRDQRDLVTREALKSVLIRPSARSKSYCTLL